MNSVGNEGRGPHLTAMRVSAETLDLVPATARRDWMDATRDRFANRCLPLLMANQSGWFVTTRRGIQATWDGGAGIGAIVVTALDGGAEGVPQSHFGSGVLTWTLPWLFRTDPGWNLLARGPTNWPKDGAYALDGLVETDWTSATFTMNWLLTRPGHAVTFEAGEPICMIVPERRGVLESVVPEVREVAGPDAENYHAWRISRTDFNANLGVGPPRPLVEQWQRDYFLGNSPAAVAAGHQRRRVLAPFSRSASPRSAVATRAALPAIPVAHLPAMRRWAEQIRPHRVLVADGDVLSWSAVLRLPMPDDPTAPNHPTAEAILDCVHDGDLEAALEDAAALGERRRSWDLISLGRLLCTQSRASASELLQHALRVSPYVLAVVASKAEWCAEPELDLSTLLEAGVLQHSVDPQSGTAVAVLSHADPAGVATRRRASIASQAWAEYALEEFESRCGPGSSLAQTSALRHELPPLFERHAIRSVLDAPCGDVNWMRHVDLDGVAYVGLDVNAELVNIARAALGDDQHRFAVLDVLTEALPAADLILCRDLLVHLPLAEALALLANFQASGSSFLLTTNFPQRTQNADIGRGDWRPLNLMLPPFCLPPPMDVIIEHCTESGGAYADKSLGLWRLPDLLR